MVYNKLPKNTPDLLRKAGLKVVELDGWYESGRPNSTGDLSPVGVLCHHTATRKSLAVASVLRLLRVGRPDLPGPLCNFGLGRDGTVYIVAAGRANHAGKARRSGTVAAGDGNKLYWGIEAFNDGVGEVWPTEQYSAYVLLCSVLSVEVTKNSSETVRGHKETSITGKVDPLFNMDSFRVKVAEKMAELEDPKKAPKPIRKPKPKPDAVHKDFMVHLVPGNKSRSTASVRHDMGLVKKLTNGNSAVVFNTERETVAERQAVTDGLGRGWTRVIENENTMAFGSNWTPTGEPTALLLAKEDPSMAQVSPRRYLDAIPLENQLLRGVTIKMKCVHCLSEANCIHTKVRGRKWREKMYPIQINDILDDLETDYKAGIPQVLSGDFNTGVYFTGNQLFALMQKRFGGKVTHAHNGGLDHVFLISSTDVDLSEVGVERRTNNESDHDMISVMVRATLKK